MALQYRFLTFVLCLIFFESVLSVPLKNNQKLESIHSGDYNKFIKEEPKDRIIFGNPLTFRTKTITPPIETRIQFPESLPEFEGKLSERRPRQGTGFRDAPWASGTPVFIPISTFNSSQESSSAFEEFFSNYDSSAIDFETTQGAKGQPFRYYWLRQWLSNKIVILNDKYLKTKLNEVEKVIEQEALRSGYLSLFQTPNLRKKWMCPKGQRRDHSGRCTTPISVVNRQ